MAVVSARFLRRMVELEASVVMAVRSQIPQRQITELVVSRMLSPLHLVDSADVPTLLMPMGVAQAQRLSRPRPMGV
jgi:hypothetical protein